MSTVLLVLALAASPPPDLAASLPATAPLFLEVADPSEHAGRLRRSPLWRSLEAAMPEAATRALTLTETLGARRLAVAAWPREAFRRVSWLILAEVPDAPREAARLDALLPATRAVAPDLLAMASDAALLDQVEAVRAGRRRPLAAREDFRAAPRLGAGDAVRFHVDLAGLLPVRPGLARTPEPAPLFFFGHLLDAAATATRLSGTIGLDGGLAVDLEAPFRALAEEHRFVAPGGLPAPGLAPPPHALLHLSLRRDLAAFWREREALIPERYRAKLVEFQSNVNVLLGGVPIEDLLAGLGTGFDLFLAREPACDPPTRHRLPTAALVAELRDPELAPELYLAFQTVVGVINASRGEARRPRLLQGSVHHRDVLCVEASFLDRLLPDPADDRRQLRPCLAVVRDRLILATHPALLRSLVDGVLDGRLAARPRRDRLAVDGAEVSRAFALNEAAIAARWLLAEGLTPEASADRTRRLLELARRIDGLELSLGVEAATARIEFLLRAPGLLAEDGR